jgi:hypothetical protein
MALVLDHADTALERWLCASLENVSVEFVESVSTVEPVPDTARGRSSVAVVLAAVSERQERRDTEVNDIRDRDGRVTARQRSLRFFDVDYRISVPGDPRRGHVVLGWLLQALVDADTIAPDHLPEPLRDLDVPVEISMPADPPPPGGGVGQGIGLLVRLVVPVAPTPTTDVAAPAVELHLDMSPAPVVGRAAVFAEDTTRRFVGERAWTTVRRREAIAPVPPDLADGSTSSTRRRPRKPS